MALAYSSGHGTARAGAGAGHRQQTGLARGEARAALLFLAPDTAGLAFFIGLPMLLSLSMGFFRVSGFGEYEFIGLANYARLLEDERFSSAICVTLVYAAVLVPAIYVSSLALALLLQRDMPLRGIWRTLFFAPHVVSLIVAATVWKFMLTSRVGFVNQMLGAVGLPGQSWLGDPQFALGAVIVVTVWFQMGFFMVIFLAALQEIPREYYESATLDGANAIQRFGYITLPQLRSTSFFVIVISIAGAVTGGASLDLVFALTAGGPARTTTMVTYFVYQQAFEIGDFGYAAAAASVLVAAMMAATLLLFVAARGGKGRHV